MTELPESEQDLSPCPSGVCVCVRERERGGPWLRCWNCWGHC